MAEISRAGIEALVAAEHGDPSKLIERLKNRECLNDDEIEFLEKRLNGGTPGRPTEISIPTTAYWLNNIEPGWEKKTAARHKARELYHKSTNTKGWDYKGDVRLLVNCLVIDSHKRGEISREVAVEILGEHLRLPK